MDADQLIAELNNLGLRYLVGEKIVVNEEAVSPDRLLAALSGHPDARIRHAVIALLLFKPDFSDFAAQAIEHLSMDEILQFKFYYTAAMLLQQIHSDRLKRYVMNWQSIPDRFLQDLGLPDDDTPLDRLSNLGELHREKTGSSVNWLGTYNHVAERLIRQLESELAWAV